VASDRGLDVVPSGWPVLIALGVVAALGVVNVVIDIAVEDRTAEHTSTLVGNALESVALADDMRAQAHQLAAPTSPDQLAAATNQLSLDIATYDPLATFNGERAEWDHLRHLLDRLNVHETASPRLIAAIEHSLDRIIAINQREADATVGAIHAVHRDEFIVDSIMGLVTLAIAIAVGLVLRRMLRRQHRLLTERLELDAERRRELEAFSARVAHDLRGPLAPLRICSDLLIAGEGPPPELGRRIARSADRMAALIEDLLALSTSGQPPVGRSDLSLVVAEVLEETAALADTTVAVHVQDVAVACPPAVLGQIVRNLVSNAAKYRSPERPLELAIDATCEAEFVELTVADNGVGMDEATASHVFEPFYRADAARSQPGHGLGLAIVKRTVDALHGACHVTSTEGRGTRFSVRLPLA